MPIAGAAFGLKAAELLYISASYPFSTSNPLRVEAPSGPAVVDINLFYLACMKLVPVKVSVVESGRVAEFFMSSLVGSEA